MSRLLNIDSNNLVKFETYLLQHKQVHLHSLSNLKKGPFCGFFFKTATSNGLQSGAKQCRLTNEDFSRHLNSFFPFDPPCSQYTLYLFSNSQQVKLSSHCGFCLTRISSVCSSISLAVVGSLEAMPTGSYYIIIVLFLVICVRNFINKILLLLTLTRLPFFKLLPV